MMLTRLHRGRALLQRLVLGVLLVCAWMVVAPTNVGGATTLVMVDGHSMEPLLYTGDLAVAVRKPSYAAGDLVVFTVAGGLVIHRLVKQGPDGRWRTQGDNKPSPDPWRIGAQQIQGRYLVALPGVGSKLRWIQRQPMVIGGVAGLFTLALFVPWRRRGGVAPESEQMPERGDSWVAAALTGFGGTACMLLVLVLVRAGAPATSAQSLALGIGGVIALGFAIYLLTELLAEPAASNKSA